MDPTCDGTTRARYEHGFVSVGCNTCDVMLTQELGAPPIIVAGHDPAANPAVLGKHLFMQVQKLNTGFCHFCVGPLDVGVAGLQDEHEGAMELDVGDHVDIRHRCRECGMTGESIASLTLIGHPVIVSLLYEQGIDYRETPLWEQSWFAEATERVMSEDPVRVEVTIAVAGQELTVTLDGDLAVVEHQLS